jgi:putative flippase GtrA
MAAKPVAGAFAQLLSFTLVGLAGLAVDAGVFVLLTRGALWSIALSRSVSVSLQIVLTWAMNRAVTFARQRSPRRGPELVRYAAVQAGGLVLNIGVFTGCLAFVPALRAVPLVALVLGAAAGFAFNFTVMRTLVFRGATPSSTTS